MASDYLVIKKVGRTNLGTQLIRAANLTKELRELIRGLTAIGSHQFDGADYTKMEAQFSLNTGEGDDALALLTLMDNIFNTSTDVTGANRASQLDEFVARLAGQ